MSATSYTIDDRGVGRLTITREAQRNALDEETLAGLSAAFVAAPHDPAVRAIVLTGEGDKAFCAGADLKGARDAFAVDFSRPKSAYADMLRAAFACSVPILGRINGACMAGGMGLLAICDIAVASDRGRLRTARSEDRYLPDASSCRARTLDAAASSGELAFTGEPLAATDARAAGLVNYVVPADELDAKTEWLAGRLVDKSPSAQRRGKAAMRAVAGLPFERSLPYLETQIATLALTPDAREGRASFVERRAPVWSGE